MSDNELPLPGPIKVDCPCGCGLFGAQVKRARGDGLRHVRLCQCRRCQGSRHRPKARRRENAIAAALGGERDVLSGALSGADVRAHLWSFEETSNVAITRGIKRWWESKGVRKKVARLYGRHGEAHALVLSWDGRPQLVVASWEDFVGQFPLQEGFEDRPGGNK